MFVYGISDFLVNLDYVDPLSLLHHAPVYITPLLMHTWKPTFRVTSLLWSRICFSLQCLNWKSLRYLYRIYFYSPLSCNKLDILKEPCDHNIYSNEKNTILRKGFDSSQPLVPFLSFLSVAKINFIIEQNIVRHFV